VRQPLCAFCRIRLGVAIDIVLFAGAATLIAVVVLRGAKNPALMRTIP